ncbi:MAG: chitobiase/beta-hexosaminidase C-terminal domain-containing protein [Terracidiphilus sp.]
MQFPLNSAFFRGFPGRAPLPAIGALRFLFPIALALSVTTALQAQKATQVALGIAWQVRGSWQVDRKGAPIVSGDAIQPGSLLQPADVGDSHSIVVLLPDGQRILYECFTAEDCARGFRVPALYRRPEPFAVDMMARVHAALLGQSHDSSGSAAGLKPRLPRDEAIAVLGPGNQVEVAGLAAHLNNGRYTYDLRPLDRATAPQFHLVFEKSGPSITLPIPSAGLYDLTIYDDLNSPRIDLLIAALGLAQAASVTKSFKQLKALMDDWNSDKEGWPIHDLQRAYLQSLLGVKPQPGAENKIASKPDPLPGGESAADERHGAGLTAEPTFTPKPGFYDGRTAIALRCDTPGATMHYTVDGSQPVNASPVYSAPIIVMGSGLTIKAFAAAAGKKDSAVVTGTYRIRGGD